jgi:hypothetical protein
MRPSVRYVQSFRSIALAVTKRAVFTDDDDDGQHMIAPTHLRWATNLMENVTKEVFMLFKSAIWPEFAKIKSSRQFPNLKYLLRKWHMCVVIAWGNPVASVRQTKVTCSHGDRTTALNFLDLVHLLVWCGCSTANYFRIGSRKLPAAP